MNPRLAREALSLKPAVVILVAEIDRSPAIYRKEVLFVKKRLLPGVPGLRFKQADLRFRIPEDRCGVDEVPRCSQQIMRGREEVRR